VGRKGLVDHPWAQQRLRVYSPTPQARRANLLGLALAGLTPDDLKDSWEVSPGQGEALETAYVELGDKGVWLTRLATDSPEALKEGELHKHALATIHVLSRRAKRIVRLPLMPDAPSQSLTGKVLDDLGGG